MSNVGCLKGRPSGGLVPRALLQLGTLLSVRGTPYLPSTYVLQLWLLATDEMRVDTRHTNVRLNDRYLRTYVQSWNKPKSELLDSVLGLSRRLLKVPTSYVLGT